jgi:hypothetical protein
LSRVIVSRQKGSQNKGELCLLLIPDSGHVVKSKKTPAVLTTFNKLKKTIIIKKTLDYNSLLPINYYNMSCPAHLLTLSSLVAKNPCLLFRHSGSEKRELLQINSV